ncbi:4'-phosphopantetheinyl transferase family protein [Fibrella aquatica]|uniref:4'-phosphopantetheinyl transferase family protein n=1 Tax=Fibrella aquatica TaxID=3242487 RepID=UPI0035214850
MLPELHIDLLADVCWKPWTGALEPNSMAVFRYHIQSTDQLWLHNLLVPDEQQRATRFRQLADKERFVSGRGWLRWLIGQLTATTPQHVGLAIGPFGKPELLAFVNEPVHWHVNVSHAGQWVLLAVGNVPVGIDVEWINPDWGYQALISSSFNAEDQGYLSISADPRTLFYTFWTRKESLIKATGQGLTNDFMDISASKGVYRAVDDRSEMALTWQTTSFSVSAGYVGAVAYQLSEIPVRFFTLETAKSGLSAPCTD